MKKQKIIPIQIPDLDTTDAFKTLNEHLEKGWTVVDKFVVSNTVLFTIEASD